MGNPGFTRLEFLKLSGLGLGSLALPVWKNVNLAGDEKSIVEFPNGERLGRVIGGKVPVKLRPDIDSSDIKYLFDDEIVIWLREIVGSRPLWYSQRFVETPDGYIYAPNLQPVQNRINTPLKSFTTPEGVWVEVTVPYVNLTLANPPARSPWLKRTTNPRLYYSQIMWVDEIKIDEQDQVWYRVKEKYGSFGDVFWAPGEAFKPISQDDFSPINADVENKNVVVNLTQQTLSCFEGEREIYFCRVSTGGKYDKDGNPSEKWSTPLGPHSIWRKMVSVHMTGGTTGGGYDLPGIGWTVLFSGNGVAIHSTYWHNSFGVQKSHGCINAQPEDAKWIFRWTIPIVPYDSGDKTISGSGSTKVIVYEG